MSIEVLYDHCPIMEGNIEAIRDKVPPDQAAELALGGEVSVFRFPLTKGQHGVITIYWDSMRFALFMGADSTWGDAEHTNQPDHPVKLWPDEEPDSAGGTWWIDPEMAAWVEGYELTPFPLDPTKALEVAREAGREWAGNLDPEEVCDGDEFAKIVANANAPAFPNCPSREIFDAAYEAAEAVVFLDED